MKNEPMPMKDDKHEMPMKHGKPGPKQAKKRGQMKALDAC